MGVYLLAYVLNDLEETILGSSAYDTFLRKNVEFAGLK